MKVFIINTNRYFSSGDRWMRTDYCSAHKSYPRGAESLVPQKRHSASRRAGSSRSNSECHVKPVTGNIVATTTTDANGYYRIEVPAGGPYIIEVVRQYKSE